VRIIDNPFDDIVPRITAEEKRAQQRARQAAIREREETARRKGAKKCVLPSWVLEELPLKEAQGYQIVKFRCRRRRSRGNRRGSKKEECRTSGL